MSVSTAGVVDAANQRNAVLAGFLGWTLDAFDFFILTLVIEDLAHAFFPGSPLEQSRPRIALAITLTLAMRPIGAVVFGLMADRFGRRIPLMLNVIFYAVISVLCGFAQTYWMFLVLRMLFGIGMGGEWGVGASLALESASPKIRGLLSGLLQEGYAIGNLLAALAFRTIYPWANAHYPGNGWRVMFFLGGLPALLSLFIRARVKESAAWHEHRTDWASYKKVVVQNGRRFFYLVLLMTMMNFMSHGTQDMYPTLLRTFGYGKARIADITMLSMVGAVLGGLAFGYYSDRSGRRRAMITAASCGLVVLPLWIAGFSPWTTIVGVFLMQFFVQGAWGVIPAHINELAPHTARAFFPGFAYQLGVMCASSIPYIESALGEMFTYKQAMGGLMVAVFLGAIVVTWRGPEAHGVSFRKA
ncbi:MAG TPA: MFS transporter [Vicinamibacterales bacterium]|jgi:SHS family lactate transporter-like MFS transporter|nr:MFS transporter [Vicinamibacterales bacterium]